jgi:signal transduction histidine kinase
MLAHIEKEHTDSHTVEGKLNEFIGAAEADMRTAAADYQSSHRLHTMTVVGFSALSVLAAMTLGFIFSWAFILPVRKVQGALGELSAGRFPDSVVVPNRDEFGSLARDLNATSDQLQTLFEHERDLAAALRETNASLARASEAKSNFLASVSHELRTPLNAVLGFTDALLAGVDGPLNEEQRTSLGWVQRGGSHLLSLINELLDLARIEAGRLVLAPEPFRPVDMVRSVIEEHRPLADPKGIGLSYRDDGAPSELVQDPQRVRQILGNLLGNAVKLTDVGEVSVILSRVDNGLRVAVRDSGPGIPDDERDAIFEEFYQAHGSEHGTGLGLSISRRLARAMGGDVSVQSEVGRGSTFVLWVPSDHIAPGDPSDEVP